MIEMVYAKKIIQKQRAFQNSNHTDICRKFYKRFVISTFLKSTFYENIEIFWVIISVF